jgi:hypothetical protein
MIQKVTLNSMDVHPLRSIIKNVGLKQYDLALSVGINQSSLSRQLRGLDVMPKNAEKKLKPKKKHQPIVKRK